MDVAKLRSFYDFLNTYLTYLIFCFVSLQQIRNRQQEGKRMAPTEKAQYH